MSYKVSCGYSKEIEKYTRFIADLEEARTYAKSLLFQPLEEKPEWDTDCSPAFIDQAQLKDTEQEKCNPNHPQSAMISKHYEGYSIWDDEFYTKLRIEHVHDLHRVMWANYYEDGRNDPLEYVLKCGKNHQFLDVYWFSYNSRCGDENYVFVKAVAENYNWNKGMPDLDEADVHIYNAEDQNLKKMLKDIRSQIA